MATDNQTTTPVAGAAAPAAPPLAGSATPTAPPPPASGAGATGTLVCPPELAQAFGAVVTPCQERLEAMCLQVASCTQDASAPAPSELLLGVMDVASTLAQLVEPYLSAPKQGAAVTKSLWTKEYIDSLPDWCFLYVRAGTERDSEYRTLPLENRMFPIADSDMRLNLPMCDAAASGILASCEPWLSPAKKGDLILNLAARRTGEVARLIRQGDASPEVVAELKTISTLVLSAVPGAGAAPAAGATPPPPPAPPAGATPPAPADTVVDMAAGALADISAACGGMEEQAKAGRPMAASRLAKMVGLHDVAKRFVDGLAELIRELDPTALATPPTETTKAADPTLRELVAKAAKADETSAQVVELQKAAKASADALAEATKKLADANAQNAKLAEEVTVLKKAVPDSNARHEETSAKKPADTLTGSFDYAAEERQRREAAKKLRHTPRGGTGSRP